MGGFSKGGVVRIEIAQVEKYRRPLSTVCPFVGTVLENLTRLTAGGPQNAFTIGLGQTFRVCNYSSIGLRQHTVLSSYSIYCTLDTKHPLYIPDVQKVWIP